MAGERFITQLDDLTLTMEFITDGGSMALVEYEYVDVAGSGFEDLGPNAMECSAVAYFNKGDYENWREFERIAQMRNTTHNFVHPARGLIFVRISNWTIRHDDRKRLAVVNFTLREELQGNDDQISPLITPRIEELFEGGQQAAIDSLGSQISGDYGSEGAALLTRVTNAAIPLAAQFSDVSAQVRRFVATVDSAIAAIEGVLGDVTQPATTLIAAIDYGTSLPGRVIGAIASCVDRYASLVDRASEAPYAALQSFYTGVDVLRSAAAGFEKQVDISRAQAGALLASEIYAEDDERRGAAQTVEQVSAWNGSGEYVGTPDIPYVYTVNDLERSLSLVRSHLQIAVNHDRSITQHADMAAALLRHVNKIKLDREKIMQIDIPTTLSLIQICHSRGLGYRAADRVMRINPEIRNPSFVRGLLSIYE